MTVLKLTCDGQVAIDAQLNITYCDRGLETIPKVYDLGDASRTIDVFPDEQTVSASGLSLQATIAHSPIGPCRRAFISLGGGNPDVPYRGEGLLYDFPQRREIARTTGDPGTAFTDYGGGAAFQCSATQRQWPSARGRC